MTARVVALVLLRADVASPDLRAEALRRMTALYPGVPLYTSGSVSLDVGGIDVRTGPAPAAALLKAALQACARPDCEQDSAAVFYDWYPLLDLDLTREVEGEHFQNLAHFTYGENLPAGLAPDFASVEFARSLPEPLSDPLRTFAFRNIDKYDVEIFYRLPDLRQHRLDFSTADARSQRLVETVLADRPGLKFANLHDYLMERPEIVRPFPSWLEVELCSVSPLWPDFWPPAPENRPEQLEAALLDKLRTELAADALDQDLSVCLGGLGEALLHPECLPLIESLCASPKTRAVFLESLGLNLDPPTVQRLAAMPHPEKITVIVRLNTLRPERYAHMYGADRLAEVLANLQHLEERADLPFQVFVEMQRLKETDDEVPAFFERFEKSRVQPLLQKFNRYIDRLPERRAADLTPLTRDFCWHLARDLYLTVQGRVPLCKQDPFAAGAAVLDFRQLTIREIFARTAGYHAASVRGAHESIPMPCLICDEWYTFNG